MSKRKNRDRSPNIPQETLERARRQVEERGADVNDKPAASESAVSPVSVQTAAETNTTSAPLVATGKKRDERRAEQGVKPRNGSSSARRAASGGELAARPRRRKSEELTLAEIEDLLEHPTKMVTEEQLHAQYGYVLADLRNMGVLAAGLFIFLIVLAQIL